jgi:hypothetical protein
VRTWPGEYLALMQKSKGGWEAKKQTESCSTEAEPQDLPPTLEDMGISKKESSSAPSEVAKRDRAKAAVDTREIKAGRKEPILSAELTDKISKPKKERTRCLALLLPDVVDWNSKISFMFGVLLIEFDNLIVSLVIVLYFREKAEF